MMRSRISTAPNGQASGALQYALEVEKKVADSVTTIEFELASCT